jgi:ribosomal protein S18 acetylase RimI-like enzyme
MIEDRSEDPAVLSQRASYIVRPARPADARSFMALWTAVVAEGRYVRPDRISRGAGHYRRAFRNAWSDDRVELVAVAGTRVIGHLTAAREEGAVCRHVASLGLAVAADWRGRGIGFALMAEASRWARIVGVEKLSLSVYPDNTAALDLYRRVGFVEEGRLTGHSKKEIGYRDEILMGLWLITPP